MYICIYMYICVYQQLCAHFAGICFAIRYSLGTLFSQTWKAWEAKQRVLFGIDFEVFLTTFHDC